MNDRGALLPELDRLFEGPREDSVTLGTLLAGLETRSYAFIVAALGLPNCVPTGIPLLSTVTGIPMLLFAVQEFFGRPAPALPARLTGRAIARGSLQDALARARPWIGRLERAVHPRYEAWLNGMPGTALHIAWLFNIFVLALPIPFDNFLPAWATMFFCLALLERDGAMAMLGWLFTLLTAAWTIFLLAIGPMVAIHLVRAVL
jgi:hypothetical protein